MKKADIGLVGLAVMGENLVMNMESKGFTVAVFNRTVEKVDAFVNGRGAGKNFIAAHSLEEAKGLQEKNGGFIKTMWCGDLQCELDMKEKAGMSSRCIPFKQENLGEVCACCGKPAKHMIYWGIAY